jgi:hypothetical protein
MSDEDPRPARPAGDRFLSKFTSIETSLYIESPALIEAFKASVEARQDLYDEIAAINEKKIRLEQELRLALESQKLASVRSLGKKDIEIAALTKELEGAGEQIRELSRQTMIAFVLSCLAAVVIAIGVNMLTSDDKQLIGGAVTALGVATQIATLFVTKRVRQGG